MAVHVVFVGKKASGRSDSAFGNKRVTVGGKCNFEEHTHGSLEAERLAVVVKGTGELCA